MKKFMSDTVSLSQSYMALSSPSFFEVLVDERYLINVKKLKTDLFRVVADEQINVKGKAASVITLKGDDIQNKFGFMLNQKVKANLYSLACDEFNLNATFSVLGYKDLLDFDTEYMTGTKFEASTVLAVQKFNFMKDGHGLGKMISVKDSLIFKFKSASQSVNSSNRTQLLFSKTSCNNSLSTGFSFTGYEGLLSYNLVKYTPVPHLENAFKEDINYSAFSMNSDLFKSQLEAVSVLKSNLLAAGIVII